MSTEDTLKNITKDMTPVDAMGMAASWIAGIGASKIVKDVIAHNTDAPENVRNKVTMYAGAAVLGMIAKDASEKYMEVKVKKWVQSYKRVSGKLQKVREENTSQDTADKASS